jgi:threonine dehydrogenase-like Zn-dependent dehydrogenase
MKALSLNSPGHVEIIDIPEPRPGPEEVIVQVGYVGLCGSDLNAYRGISPMVSYPRIIGHEVGGAIAAAGSRVPGHLHPGVRVTLSPYSHCGACPACRAGRTNACVHNETLGVQRDGALCERISIHCSKLYPSDSLSLRELALAEPLSVGYHATQVGCVTDQDCVLVLGCGAVGLGAIAAAASLGARVIALDVQQEKLGLARALGAAEVVNSAAGDAGESIAALTDGLGPAVVIEAAGSPITYRLALDSVSAVGRVVCIGYASQPVELDTKLIVRKELGLFGSRNALGELAAVIEMLASRDRPFASMISRIVPLEEAGQALAAWDAAPATVTRILVQIAACPRQDPGDPSDTLASHGSAPGHFRLPRRHRAGPEG